MIGPSSLSGVPFIRGARRGRASSFDVSGGNVDRWLLEPGESRPFTRDEMTGLIDLAEGGIRDLFGAQQAALKEAGITVSPATATAS